MVELVKLRRLAQKSGGFIVFYDLFCILCEQKGVSPTRAALDIGLSKSTPTTWKKKGTTPQAAQLQKIADYFDVTVGYLLGTETKQTPTQKVEVTDDDIKFALFGGGPVSDAQYEEVKQFVRFIKERDAHGKKE